MKLQELFETLDSNITLDVILKTKHKYHVNCDISANKKITIYADFMFGNNHWDVGFYEVVGSEFFGMQRFGKTRTGEELKVFSAVKKFFENFIKMYKPEKIYFESDKEDKSERSLSRTSLYKKLTIRYAKSLGYEYSVKENSKFYDRFVLTKI